MTFYEAGPAFSSGLIPASHPALPYPNALLPSCRIMSLRCRRSDQLVRLIVSDLQMESPRLCH